MIDYKKINDVMCWKIYDSETDEQAFVRNCNKHDDLPNSKVIDVVHAGGLLPYSESLRVESPEELFNKILKIMRTVISDPIFQDPKKIKTFPPFTNFFKSCTRIDINGGLHKECLAITNLAWNGKICRRNIDERTEKIFSNPISEKFDKAVLKIKDTYNFTDKEIDSLRYFVCQTRHVDHNPSLNKSIYHWGDDKKTGKTTIAKIIVTILNGDTLQNAGTYSSKLNKELQFNKHDVPKAAIYNAVFLDEAMPKDSRKSYGAFKSMLTDNSCDFEPKFKDSITIHCKRFYYITSNDDVSEFIQDEKERRIVPIHSKSKPKQMSFEDIYSLWFDFCTNAIPEENWQRWYDSFDMVDGLAKKDSDEAKSEILLNYNAIFGVDCGTYTTSKQVANKIYKNEPTREQKKTVKNAMESLFENARLESNKSNYIISMCRKIASEINNGEVQLNQEIISEMPF